jgi:hypothetical protein
MGFAAEKQPFALARPDDRPVAIAMAPSLATHVDADPDHVTSPLGRRAGASPRRPSALADATTSASTGRWDPRGTRRQIFVERVSLPP